MEKKDKNFSGTNFAVLSQLGFSMAAPIVSFVLIGRVVENRMDTGGIVFIISIVLGVIVGGMYFYRTVKNIK